MSDQDAFDRILASLHEATLDDALWPTTSALIDEAVGSQGNTLLVGDGPKDDIRVLFVGLYYRGERRPDLEREYLTVYHPLDESIPRFRQLPDSHVVHATHLYTAQELQTSVAYNEGLRRLNGQDGLRVRLDGPAGSHISWGLADPVAPGGWDSPQLALIKGLLPHIRQFVRVRQALGGAEALGTAVTDLLDTSRVGVLHLDRRGRIVEANDHARRLLRHGAGLSDRGGELRAWLPADQARLARLLAGALPASSAPAVGGSLLLRRAPGAGAGRGARHPRGRAAAGLRRAARGRAGAAGRAGTPGAYRSRPGGHDPGADAGREPGGGRAGGGPDRTRHCRGHGAAGKLHPLAPEAHLSQAGAHPAGGVGPAGAGGHRVRLSVAAPARAGSPDWNVYF